MWMLDEFLEVPPHSSWCPGSSQVQACTCTTASFFSVSFSSSKTVPHHEESDARVCLSCTVVTKSIIGSLHTNNSSCFCTQACFSRDMQLFSLQIRQEVSLCSGVRPESPQWPLEIEQVHGNVYWAQQFAKSRCTECLPVPSWFSNLYHAKKTYRPLKCF